MGGAFLPVHPPSRRQLHEMKLPLTSIHLLRAPAGIRSIEPLMDLSSWIAPTILICSANAWIRSDAELGIPKAGANSVSKTTECLVGCIHPRCQTVANELNISSIVWNFDKLLSRCNMNRVNLYTVGPIGDSQLEGHWVNWPCQVRARRISGHEQMSSTGRDVGE